MRRIRITLGSVACEAWLADNATADGIWEALPLSGTGNRWGDEVYFEIPVRLPLAADARDVLEAGDLGYWLRATPSASSGVQRRRAGETRSGPTALSMCLAGWRAIRQSSVRFPMGRTWKSRHYLLDHSLGRAPRGPAGRGRLLVRARCRCRIGRRHVSLAVRVAASAAAP